MVNYQSHWNTAYQKTPVTKLGWFEVDPEPSMRLINAAKIPRDALVLNVGAGATTLVDHLLEEGYTNVIVNDISEEALKHLRERLGDNAQKITWVRDDLVNPDKLNDLPLVDLWHDRAVAHFFTEEADQQTYFDLVRSKVKKMGYVIIAAFNLDGATKCSGLPVYRYDKNLLIQKLGSDFELLASFDYLYTMPSGDTRNYVYTLFQRNLISLS